MGSGPAAPTARRRSPTSAPRRERSLVDLRVLLELAGDGESDLLRDPGRLSAPLTRAPDRERFVAVAQHAAVSRLIAIDFWIGICEADQVAQRVQIVGLPR